MALNVSWKDVKTNKEFYGPGDTPPISLNLIDRRIGFSGHN